MAVFLEWLIAYKFFMCVDSYTISNKILSKRFKLATALDAYFFTAPILIIYKLSKESDPFIANRNNAGHLCRTSLFCR